MYAPAGAAHYIVLRIGVITGAKLPSWTIRVFKNGAYVSNIPVSVSEPLVFYYRFAWTDDGTHNCQWHVLISHASAPATIYTYDFFCAKPIIENGVTHIKSIVGNG